MLRSTDTTYSTGKDYILLLSKDIQLLFSYTVHNLEIDN